MSNATTGKGLEICTDVEWWEVFGPLDIDGCETDAESINDFVRTYQRELQKRGFAVDDARGQRRTCHGWNGANTFEWQGAGIGTFDRMTEAQQASTFEAFEAAQKAWRAANPELPPVD